MRGYLSLLVVVAVFVSLPVLAVNIGGIKVPTPNNPTSTAPSSGSTSTPTQGGQVIRNVDHGKMLYNEFRTLIKTKYNYGLNEDYIQTTDLSGIISLLESKFGQATMKNGEANWLFSVSQRDGRDSCVHMNYHKLNDMVTETYTSGWCDGLAQREGIPIQKR